MGTTGMWRPHGDNMRTMWRQHEDHRDVETTCGQCGDNMGTMWGPRGCGDHMGTTWRQHGDHRDVETMGCYGPSKVEYHFLTLS